MENNNNYKCTVEEVPLQENEKGFTVATPEEPTVWLRADSIPKKDFWILTWSCFVGVVIANLAMDFIRYFVYNLFS